MHVPLAQIQKDAQLTFKLCGVFNKYLISILNVALGENTVKSRIKTQGICPSISVLWRRQERRRIRLRGKKARKRVVRLIIMYSAAEM